MYRGMHTIPSQRTPYSRTPRAQSSRESHARRSSGGGQVAGFAARRRTRAAKVAFTGAERPNARA